jgi:AAA domain
MSFEIKKATRVGVRPLIGLYSESGCGKTYSALLLARGLVGPTGKIVMADSESGRGSLYADVLPGGYDTLELGQPFSPARYIEAIDAVEQSGAAVGIIDSASHEWEGIGGVLDLATQNEERTGKAGLHCWKAPKLEHAKFMLRMLQSSIPWIVCLRAKYKSRQTKVDGKTQIVKDEATSPIQAEDFIFEMTCHMEILQNHTPIVTKCSHPALRACFPEDKKEPIAIKHGELLAAWCSNPSGSKSQQSSKKAATETTRTWMLEQLKSLHVKMQQYAIDKGLIMPNEGLESWPLSKVPTERTGLNALKAEIEAHQ